ncbi:hypothetical protein [Photobacterium phosphoreum]|uniref:hypothetical protein n=1 Tax=Photobacterium phosphoreum TaxID=659 RepID=UPI000A498A95
MTKQFESSSLLNILRGMPTTYAAGLMDLSQLSKMTLIYLCAKGNCSYLQIRKAIKSVKIVVKNVRLQQYY